MCSRCRSSYCDCDVSCTAKKTLVRAGISLAIFAATGGMISL